MLVKKANKYKNVKVDQDGLTFDSKAERDRYGILKALLKCGAIQNLRVQPVYELEPKQPGIRAVRYIGDFEYQEKGKTICEDVKGVLTQAFKIKRNLFSRKYPDIELRVVKAK